MTAMPGTFRVEDRRDARGSRLRRRTGAVLLVVLAIVAMLAALAVTFAYRMRAELSGVNAVSYDYQARLAAEAGIHRAMLLLRNDRVNFDKWYDNPEAFRQIIVWTPGEIGGKTALSQDVPEGQPVWRFSIVSPGEQLLTDTTSKWRYGMTDEAGKLNINMAPREQLVALFLQLKLENVTAEELADSLIDWRDSDDNTSEFGAETPYYAMLNPPYRAKNAALETVEELLQVKNFHGTILYGEDANRNGHLDKNEDDGEEGAWPPDDGDGILDRGIYPYVTVCSRDMNRANDNAIRLNINGSLNTDKLPDEVKQEIEQNLRPEVKEFIEAARKRNHKFQSVAELFGLTIGGKQDEEGDTSKDGDDKKTDEQPADDAKNDSKDKNDAAAGNDNPNGDAPPAADETTEPPPPPDGGTDEDVQSKKSERRNQARRGGGRREAPPTMDDLERLRNEQGSNDGSQNGGNSGTGEGSRRGSRRGGSNAQPGGQDTPRDSRRDAAGQGGDGQGRSTDRGGQGRRDGQGGRNGQDANGGTGPHGADTGAKPPTGDAGGAAAEQPPLDSPVTADDLPFLMDRFTADASPIQYGLINVNTASRQVLMTLPGLTAQDADAIVSARQGVDATLKQTPAWLVTQNAIPPEKFRRIGKYITARSLQYTIESFGFADHVGAFRRLQVVVEMRGQVEQVLYWRDISSLGVAYPLHSEDDEWKHEISVGNR